MIISLSAANVLRSNSSRTIRSIHKISFCLPLLSYVKPRIASGLFNIRVARTQKPARLRPGNFCCNLSSQKIQSSPGKTHLITSANSLTSQYDGSLETLHTNDRRRHISEPATAADDFLPPNLSTTFVQAASASPRNSIRRLVSVLLSLSKPRLTILVVLTACASYALYPVPDLLLPSSTSTPSISPLTLFFLTSGTALCAASANAFNMLYEPQWDALMKRTRNRPLVRGLISARGATIFAVLTGIAGVTSLYFGVNSTVSFLGLFNIALYAGVYTPLKRFSVLNTWVGAIVGGLPPLMGWAAAAGQSATNGGNWRELLLGEWNVGGWLLAGLLFAWQFPHFMSLSWSVREDYKQAGYRMLCWVNPARNARVALRYSLLFFPICTSLCYFGVTEWSFAFISAPINTWLLLEAVKFWKYQGARGSARNLFWASVWHLPVVMILAMVEKKGIWQKVWRALSDNEEVDE